MKIYQNLKSYNSFIQYFYRQNQSFEYIVLFGLDIWLKSLLFLVKIYTDPISFWNKYNDTWLA